MGAAAPSTGQVAGSGAPYVLPSVRRDGSRSEGFWRGLRERQLRHRPVRSSCPLRSAPKTSSAPLTGCSLGLAVLPVPQPPPAQDLPPRLALRHDRRWRPAGHHALRGHPHDPTTRAAITATRSTGSRPAFAAGRRSAAFLTHLTRRPRPAAMSHVHQELVRVSPGPNLRPGTTRRAESELRCPRAGGRRSAASRPAHDSAGRGRGGGVVGRS
jgi:hypothetical protein